MEQQFPGNWKTVEAKGEAEKGSWRSKWQSSKFKISIIMLCLKTMFCCCFVCYICPSSKEMYCSLVTKLCLTLLQSHGRQPARLLVHGISQKNTGASCHFLLQGIFLQEFTLILFPLAIITSLFSRANLRESKQCRGVFPCGSVVKNPPGMREP